MLYHLLLQQVVFLNELFHLQKQEAEKISIYLKLYLIPFLLTIPLQKLAFYSALEKGYDIDKPRNLAKSVTVE